MRSYRRFFQKGSVPHPGEMLRDLYLEPLKITVLDAANSLGLTEAKLYCFLRGKEGLDQQLANKLAVMFGTSAAFWMNLQRNHDISSENIK